MSNFQDILQSFKIKETLNPKVWDDSDDPSKSKLKKEIRDGLLDIADTFVDYLGEDIFVDDVVLTGSLSNYNWSNYSDFDLHIIIDFTQFEDDADLYKQLFDLKKQVFNDKHDIKVKGYDVELYAQDATEKHVSTGEYSVKNDEWVKEPKKQKIEIDDEIFREKIETWKNKIDRVLENPDSEKLEKIKSKLKEYRQCGLDKDGELSYENLVFKFLRRTGYIEKLFKELNKSLDKELSIETQISEQEDFFNAIKKKVKEYIPKGKEFVKDILKKLDVDTEEPVEKEVPTKRFSFRDTAIKIIDEIEGGYYHPDMLKDGRIKDKRYSKSGETLFGLDRARGSQEKSSDGKKFWSLVDKQNARKKWDYNYKLDDNQTLKNQLIDLVVKIMEPLFVKNVNTYLTKNSKLLVLRNYPLYVNFVVATWNGSGWFRTFANKINEQVKKGNKNPKKLFDIAIEARENSGNSLISSKASKVEKIGLSAP